MHLGSFASFSALRSARHRATRPRPTGASPHPGCVDLCAALRLTGCPSSAPARRSRVGSPRSPGTASLPTPASSKPAWRPGPGPRSRLAAVACLRTDKSPSKARYLRQTGRTRQARAELALTAGVRSKLVTLPRHDESQSQLARPKTKVRQQRSLRSGNYRPFGPSSPSTPQELRGPEVHKRSPVARTREPKSATRQCETNPDFTPQRRRLHGRI